MAASRPTRGPANTAKRLLAWGIFFLLAAWITLWSWQQPFMAKPRALWELSRMSPSIVLAPPVQGVRASRIADTFGAPRGRDRTHAGVDIFAKRGTPVLSATRGIVVSIREGGLGGRQVWVYGPGAERHYYAHLDGWQHGLKTGDLVAPGTPLGTVGTTGNARGTPPHLHYGLYGKDGARDPLPLLKAYAR